MCRIATKLRYGLIAFVIVGTVALFATRAAQSQEITDRTDRSSYAEIDTYIDHGLKALNAAGASLAIVEGNRLVHVKGFGIAGPSGETPTPQTTFFICSLTKSFTALAVMQLVESGKIGLDEPVQSYLPWFTLADRESAEHLTVRQLLNQTSGLSMNSEWHTLTNFDQGPNAAEEQARELASFKPDRPVGSKYEYSNTNYNLLGLVVEAASGERYADYVQRHIFRPLGMSNTYTSKAEARKDDMSSGYISWFGVAFAVPDLPVPVGSLASGQIISSAEDMAHFLIAQLNGGVYEGARVLSSKGIAAMHEAAADATTMGIPLGYGMGWFSEKTPQGPRFWHDGTAPDYFSFMALLPDQNKAMVLLVNTNELVMNFAAFSFLGGDVATLAAGGEPPSRSWGAAPWIPRTFLLIPILQILAVLMIFRKARRWRRNTENRPGGFRKWVYLALLPIPNLVLIGAASYFAAGGVLRFWLLYMADLSWLVLLCGGIALVWIVVRTHVIIEALRAPSV